jgi:hypothetical protein
MFLISSSEIETKIAILRAIDPDEAVARFL